MASRVEGFDKKILACAKEEFLEKGYTDASIRTIAQNAGVSTSTIYTRYSDKEGLFRFLVEPAANGLKELLRQSLNGFSSLTEHEQNEKIMEYSDRGFEGVIAYIYEYFSEFKLLITRAPENYYQDFLEGLVELDTGCTKKFLIQAGSKALAEGRITDGFLHVVSSAFYLSLIHISGIWYRAGRSVLKEPRSKPEGKRISDTGRRYHHYLCKRDPGPHYGIGSETRRGACLLYTSRCV